MNTADYVDLYVAKMSQNKHDFSFLIIPNVKH